LSVRLSAATTADRLLPQRLALRARPLLGRIDALLLAPDERGEAGRMSVIAFATRVVSAVIAFVSQVLIARWIGSFEYGIFVVVWTTMIIIGGLSCLGFHTSVVRFIPEYRQLGRLAELRGILLSSRLFVLGVSTIFALLGALGIWALSDGLQSYYIVPFLLGMTCLPMVALSDLLQGIARGHSWPLSAMLPTYIVRPVLILVFMVLMLAAGFAADARTGILAAIAATYATSVVQLFSITQRIDAGLPDGSSIYHFRQWFIVSLPIFLVESFFFLLTNVDVLMVGFYLQPEDVAVYFATVKTLALVHFVYFAVKAGAAARYAQFNQGEPEKLAAFARETVSWTFWPSLLMAAAVLALGEPMLALFGPEFVSGYPLLFLLLLGVLARAAVGPCESLLTMSGNQNICAAVYALTLALNVGLNVFLIPHFHLWGAAISTAFAMVLEAALLSFTVWRRLGITMTIFVPARRPA
jgi:O-antigen/teichoic acid export membrane protein